MKIKILNKSKVNLHGLAPGNTLVIDADENGVPTDKNWFRRFRDATQDGCIEVVKEEKKEVKKNKTKEDKE